ncbi:hypothetical protein [Winogradskyella undariae]|uniref:hypothetical protein n=1 Tax=Winogradskyella undariae TaxID=1285465 RepID=UPI0015CAB0CE|nr:hypothetical protein [Winogradskyella undariae]
MVDFILNGLTYAYSKFLGEPNVYRIGNVVSEISFGVLHFNFKTKKNEMEMRGGNNIKLNELTQKY